MQLIQVAPSKATAFNPTFRNLTCGALLVPDRDGLVPTNVPAAVDQATLAALEGTYTFPSSSSLDRLGPFGAVGRKPGVVAAVHDELAAREQHDRGWRALLKIENRHLHDGDSKATSLVLNPGPWEITGQRIN
jgi:hypothetical protein